jgi:pimeloyl-ACP methyl ester carboxylesterase
MQFAPRRLLLLILANLALGLLSGCCTVLTSSRLHTCVLSLDDESPFVSQATALEQAVALEADGNEACVDAYFRACAAAWHTMAASPTCDESAIINTDCYNDALTSLLRTAKRFRRLDTRSGLVIRSGELSIRVPCTHQGFAWQAGDFQCLLPPPTNHQRFLTRRYACGGVGCPLVVVRSRRECDPIEARFFPTSSFFAATAVLRFDDATQAPNDATTAVLDFYNPVQVHQVSAASRMLPLANDLSAPLAEMLNDAPRTYLAGFVDPGGAAASARLNLLEPYQPGKIPVVLIHGLYADPLSWSDMVNDLQATPGFADRHQLWLFRYPTGQGFLQSAAALRRELRAAVLKLDPERHDPALQQIVLVGHSMGGLIAKLQVTHSEERIWSQIANRPLEEIHTTESTRALLAEICYFDPSPDIARVIFIASPHRGSLCSSALIGQGASLLVKPSEQQEAMHQQLIRDNPEVFHPEMQQRLPTSVDLLMPKSPLLAVMQCMRIAPGVDLHNMVGVSHPVSLDGPSDGIVSARSAFHPGCRSMVTINSPHAQIHRTQAASGEVLRILGCSEGKGKETVPVESTAVHFASRISTTADVSAMRWEPFPAITAAPKARPASAAPVAAGGR